MLIISILFFLTLIATISVADIFRRIFNVRLTSALSIMLFFAVIQISHYPFLLLNTAFKFINVTTIFLYVVLIIYFLFNLRNSIKAYLSSYSRIEWVFVFLLFVIMLFLYSNIMFQLRTDDLNVYVLYMNNRVFSEVSQTLSNQYDFQAYYSWLSSMWYIYQRFSVFPFYEYILPLGFMAWFPSLLLFYFLSVSLIDIHRFLLNYFSMKKVLFASILNGIYTLSLFWYLGFPSYGNQFRRVAVILILIQLFKYIENNNKVSKYILGFSLISLITFSATGLFLSGIILYSILFLMLYQNKNNIIRDLLIISPGFVIFSLLYKQNFGFVILSIYLIGLIINIFKFDKHFEKFLKRTYNYIFFIIPILMVLITLIFPQYAGYNVFENFFSNPDLEMLVDYLSFDIYNISSLFLSSFNIFIWLVMGIFIIKYIKKTELSSIVLFILIILWTFFNPWVFKFVMSNLTYLAYFRIYDILINPLTISLFILVTIELFQNKIYEYMSSILIIILFIGSSYYSRIMTYFNFNSNLNSFYHVPQEQLNAINNLSGYISEDVKENGVNVVAQIYGHHLLTYNNVGFVNLFRIDTSSELFRLKDDRSKLNQIFLIKNDFMQPPYYDYTETCKITEKFNVDFVIVETQYNWDIENSLGFCGEYLYTEGTYRVYQMRYEWLK